MSKKTTRAQISNDDLILSYAYHLGKQSVSKKSTKAYVSALLDASTSYQMSASCLASWEFMRDHRTKLCFTKAEHVAVTIREGLSFMAAQSKPSDRRRILAMIVDFARQYFVASKEVA